MLSSFITDVMTLAGLGMLLDTILVGKDERIRIAQYLEREPDKESLTQRFLEFLSLSHSIIFGRYFSENLFSFSFFRSAVFVSLTSFAVVIGIQIYFDGEVLSGVRFDGVQIGIFVAFIIFNIFFDYLTIIQTKIFIEASISAKSIFRSIIFIVSDLLVTMNMFILSFAFFTMLVIQFFVWPTEELSFIRSKGAESNATEIESIPDYLVRVGATSVAERLEYTDNFSGLLISASKVTEQQVIHVYYDSTINPEEHDLQPLIVSVISRLNVETDGKFTDIKGPLALELARTIEEETGISRWIRDAKPVDDNDLLPVEEMRLSVNGSIADNGDWSAAYTMTFNRTDALEDGFPMMVFGNLEILRLDRFIADTMSNEQNNSAIAVCIFKNGAVSRFSISEKTASFLENCNEFLTVEFLWHRNLTRDFSVAGRDLEKRIVPYNTLLITSLLPTLLFYVVIVLMALATLLFSKLLSGTNRVKRYFLRAPLAITGFLVGIPLALLGWL